MELFTTPADEQVADAVWAQAGFMTETPVVCLNPGAAFGASKHWSVESFAELARSVVDQTDQHVLVLCGPNERELARQQYVGLVASGWHAEPTHGGFVVLSAVGIHVGQPQEVVSGHPPELCWVAYRAGWRESPVLGAQMS